MKKPEAWGIVIGGERFDGWYFVHQLAKEMYHHWKEKYPGVQITLVRPTPGDLHK
jgi:hypothetical protein